MVSETLLVDDRGSMLLELRFADPHGLESGERTKNRTTNPGKELSFRGSDNVNLGSWRDECLEFLGNTLGQSWEHCVSSTEHYICIKIFSNIEIALHDGLIDHFLKSWHLKSVFSWPEQWLCASESLVA